MQLVTNGSGIWTHHCGYALSFSPGLYVGIYIQGIKGAQWRHVTHPSVKGPRESRLSGKASWVHMMPKQSLAGRKV